MEENYDGKPEIIQGEAGGFSLSWRSCWPAAFCRDPLYCKLIPDENTRERLLPKLFACDLTEFFDTCEIYSDSPEMNSLLVVSR